MKYSNREDRDIRNTIRKTPPYTSRSKISKNYSIARVVDSFSGGLGHFSETKPALSKAAIVILAIGALLLLNS